MGKETPEEAWARLTDVERTALQVAYGRWIGSLLLKQPASNKSFYEDPYGQQMVQTYMPASVQKELKRFFAPEVFDATRGSTTADIVAAAAAAAVAPDTLTPTAFKTTRAAFMAVRTAALDDLIRAALAANPTLTQVVVLGAGMDTRAWRFMDWLPDTTVYEVDTPSMTAFKQQLMSPFHLTCSRRAAVVADARDLSILEQQLLTAGFQPQPQLQPPAATAGGPGVGVMGAGDGAVGLAPPTALHTDENNTAATAAAALNDCARNCSGCTTVARNCSGCTAASHGSTVVPVCGHHEDVGAAFAAPPCTLWLLEGFIGYLSREDGNALLRWMAQVSQPGSVLLMTAPPGRDEEQHHHDYVNRLQQQQQQEAEHKAGHQAEMASQHHQQQPAGRVAGGASVGSFMEPPQSAAAAEQGCSFKLYHAVYEEPEESAARVEAAGWQLEELLPAEVLADRYGTQRAQALIRARTR